MKYEFHSASNSVAIRGVSPRIKVSRVSSSTLLLQDDEVQK